jgi:hypothetical protein
LRQKLQGFNGVGAGMVVGNGCVSLREK